MKQPVIAVDGHSSCGKSTLAKKLAAHYGCRYVDTGAMYRAVTLYALKNGMLQGEVPSADRLKEEIDSANIKIDFVYNVETQKSETMLNEANVESEIRDPKVSVLVSSVAALPFVRRYLVAQQQKIGENGGVVMDGRDIGTVVFPNADVKIFLTASIEVRAKRRYDEIKNKGTEISFEEVKENLVMRDKIDSTREDSPLKKAEDAVLIDNSDFTVEETFREAVRTVNNILK